VTRVSIDDDCMPTFLLAWSSLDDRSLHFILKTDRRKPRRNRVGSVEADHRVLGVFLPAQTEAVLDGKQKTTHSLAGVGDPDLDILIQVTVDSRVRLAVQAVEILSNVNGVLMAAITERATLLVDLQWIGATRAAAGMFLKLGHHEFLVVFELPYRDRWLGSTLVDGRHGG